MADNGRWFKLWCSSVGDPGLDNLSIADFGRWAKLGAIIKEHGNEGKLVVSPPAKGLCSSLQLADFEALIVCVSLFPNVQMRRANCPVSTETITSVSFEIEFCNWAKYQGDYSTPRVKKFRDSMSQMKRSKRRGEENKKRREKESLPVSPPAHSDNGFSSWPPEWEPIKNRINSVSVLTSFKHWLCDLAWWKDMDELFSSCPKNLDALLMEAAAYISTEGYRPRSSRALRLKLRNCMEFSARRAEREAQDRRHGSV